MANQAQSMWSRQSGSEGSQTDFSSLVQNAVTFWFHIADGRKWMKAHALYSRHSQLVPCYQVAVAMANVKRTLVMASQSSTVQSTLISHVLPVSSNIFEVFREAWEHLPYSFLDVFSAVDMMHVLNLLFLAEAVKMPYVDTYNLQQECNKKDVFAKR